MTQAASDQALALLAQGLTFKKDDARIAEAIACFEKAAALAPQVQAPWLEWIVMLERLSRLDEAVRVLAEAKARCADWALSIVELKLARRTGEAAAVIAAFEPAVAALPDNAPASARFFAEMGQLHDMAGSPARAFDYFSRANRAVLADPNIRAISRETYPAMMESCLYFAKDPAFGKWPPAKVSGGRADPVFLVGFPRSGTTLLDQILSSHPAVAVAEERQCLNDVIKYMGAQFGMYPMALPDLTAPQARILRDEFFRLHESFGLDRKKPVMVDKFPLNLLHADIIHRLFPNAKFILALRHPCDCVLSCFMQQFVLNEAMVHFLDLKSAAVFYDRAFTLWDQYRARLPLRIHAVKYEDVVADFRPTVAALLDFLGLPWDEAVMDYDKTARERGVIRTPSYHQVTRKIYTDASGRWERYSAQMAPVLPLLAPWAEKLGYPPIAISR